MQGVFDCAHGISAIDSHLMPPLPEEARRQHGGLSDDRLREVFSADFELNARGLGVRLDAQTA